MKKLFIFLVFNICLFKVASAQKEFNNWFFGSESGLSFGSGAPVFTPGKLISSEGCSSTSDKQGNLLFYTNGVTVWDRTGNPMPNGTGLKGDIECAQTALITNHPGNDSIYYIFTVAKEGEPNGLQYSVVNIKLNGGLGDIIPGQKNIPFNLVVTEKLAAVKHRNRNDIWILAHEYGSDRFVEYLIDCNGLLAFPRFISVGPVINTTLNTAGYLKGSPDGKKLAMTNFGGSFELFDFNDATGDITNAQTIPNPVNGCGPYGVEFSPDSKLLYFSGAYICNSPITYAIYQFKVDTTNIGASQKIIDVGGTNVAGALQLAPDNKIYIAYNGESFVGAITNPNVPGPGCTLIKQYVPLTPPAFSQAGLPNTAAAYDKTLLGKDTVICDGTSLVIKLNLPNTTYEWKGGSVLDSILITASGQYWIKITHNTCVYYDTINVTIQASPIVKLGKDTSVCENKFPFVLKDSIPGATYLWQDSSTNVSFSAPGAGTYWLKTTLNGCSGRDSVVITPNPVSPFSLGADTTVCSSTPLTLTVNVTSASYLWNTGSRTKSIIADTSGLYWCEAINSNGCSYRDSIRVTVRPAPVVNIGRDTALCENKFPLRFAQSITNATYLWQDGSTDSSFSAPGAGVYWMQATLNGCSARDSVNVLARAVDTFNLGRDTIICGTQLLTLTVAPQALTRFLWNTGTTARSILAGSSGTYWCEATNANGCSYRDSIQVTFRPKPVVNIGKDTAVCQNKFPLRFAQAIPNATYLWQDGSTDSSLSVSVAGLYWMEATVAGCSSRDSVMVTSSTVTAFSLGADSIICSKQPLTLTVTPAFTKYLWSTGATSQSISVSSTGLYWCEATNNSGCSYRDTINLSFNSASSVNLGRDTSLCQDKLPLTIGQNIGNATYLWQDGSTNALYSVSGPGLYWMQATVNGCSVRDSININVGNATTFNLGPDTANCANRAVTLTVNQPFTKYLWNTGNTTNSISVLNQGQYWLEATNNFGCVYRDTINVSFKPAPVVNIGNDTSVCQNKLPLILGQNINGATYLWQDGSTDATYSAALPGVYWMQATLNGCSARDSINISTGQSTTFNLGADTVICSSQPLQLSVNGSFSKYLWSTGNTTSNINVSVSGNYWLEVTNNTGCSYRDSIRVDFRSPPLFSLGSDTIICSSSYLLDVSNTGDTYKWQDNSTLPQFRVNRSGSYRVTVSKNGCVRSDTVAILLKTKPVPDLGVDRGICAGEELILNPEVTGTTLTWQDGSSEPTLKVIAPGRYSVQAENECGIGTDEVVISSGSCKLMVPNAFTPNKSTNNTFRLLNAFALSDYKLQVFNRWGHQVYQTSIPTEGWDGKYKGVEQPSGMYVYIISYKESILGNTINGNRLTQKGTVMLIR